MIQRLSLKLPWQTTVRSGQILAQFAASLGLALLFFTLWPTNQMWDDGAIVLKYMDNFARGAFYSYNIADGPIFGISGFLHGILAGMLAASHLFSPLDSLFASNFIGLALTAFFLFRILSHYLEDMRLATVAWLVVALSAPTFVANVKQGLETPLHVAVVLAYLLAFLSNRPRLMWFLAALVIISKLDSAPIVVVVSLAYLWLHWPRTRAQTKQLFANLLIAVAPLVVWVGFCLVVFGSPLPQSMLAKFEFHQNAAADRFGFLELFVRGQNRYTLVLAGLLVSGYIVLCLWRRRYSDILTNLIVGWAGLAYVAGYVFFNPLERMSWYYALPELLLRLQIVIIAAVVLAESGIPRRLELAISVAVLAAVAYFSWPMVNGTVRSTLNYITVIETERIGVGQWIHTHSDPSDTLLAGHGYIAQASGLYTIDYSGLNSRAATARQNNFGKLVSDFQPDWIAMHGLLDPTLQARYRYELRQSFYNVAASGFLPWRVYQRSDSQAVEVAGGIGAQLVSADGPVSVERGHVRLASGTKVQIQPPDGDQQYGWFTAGIPRSAAPLELTIKVYNPRGAKLETIRVDVPAAQPDAPLTGYTQELHLPLAADWTIDHLSITARDDHGDVATVQLLEPLFVTLPRM